ncbi:MAG: glycosyltransferase family 9 protein [Bacteroidota bacterium]
MPLATLFYGWMPQKKIREFYPSEKVEIIFIGNAECSDIAKICPYWNKFIPIDKDKYFRNIFYRWLVRGRLLLKRNISECICPTYSRDFVADKLMRFIRAKRKVAVKSNDLSNITTDLLNASNGHYTEFISFQSEENELIINNIFINKLLHLKSDPGLADLSFVENEPLFADLQKKHNLPDKYFLFFPYTGEKFKNWQISNFKQLAERLDGTQILFCGKEKKHTTLKCNNVIDLVNKTSLIELCVLISKSHLAVTGDSCAAHIAAAMRIPSVCILGGGHFGRFLPYNLDKSKYRNLLISVYNKMDCFNCNWKCKYTGDKAFSCVSSITVDQVWKVIEKTVSKKEGENELS